MQYNRTEELIEEFTECTFQKTPRTIVAIGERERTENTNEWTQNIEQVQIKKLEWMKYAHNIEKQNVSKILQ